MARMSVVLDDALIERCQRATGIRSPSALIDHALRELLRHGQQKKILELKGKIAWQWDLRAWRRGRPCGLRKPRRVHH